jgi:hypothetical protein
MRNPLRTQKKEWREFVLPVMEQEKSNLLGLLERHYVRDVKGKGGLWENNKIDESRVCKKRRFNKFDD